MAKLAPSLAPAPVALVVVEAPVEVGSEEESPPVDDGASVAVALELELPLDAAVEETTVAKVELAALVEVEDSSLVEVLAALVEAEEALVEEGAAVEETLVELSLSEPVLALPVPPETLMLCQLPVLSLYEYEPAPVLASVTLTLLTTIL